MLNPQEVENLARETVDAAKREALWAALVEANGAITRAARRLGINTKTAYNQIERFGLRERLNAAFPLSARQPRADTGKPKIEGPPRKRGRPRKKTGQ